MNRVLQESPKKLNVKYWLIVVMLCVGALYIVLISIFGWKDLNLKIKQKIVVVGKVIQIKFIERKVVVGVTTRHEFERLFTTQFDGGISNYSCSTSFYCYDNKVVLRVDFETRKDNPSWSCNPNAKIVAPIIIERGSCATD